MQFLSDLYVRCAECEGRRFQSHVLRVQLHGKSIHEVLQLTVGEAIEFFARIGESEKFVNRRAGKLSWMMPTPAPAFRF